MRCLICKQIYFERRTLLTLFTEVVTVKCKSCQEKYQVFPYGTVYPITNYQLFMITLFNEKNTLSEDAFMLEIRDICIQYLSKAKDSALILFIDELSEALFYYLDQLNFTDIYLISLYPPAFLI
ncbi:MAG: hypothetical protein CVV63_02910 [Tenericutes bacterium HGW-Tenericutes-8]|nr:MAG: hypothetical protein CVV63_02910 [Tenericutes bacterium HGW-Tenericutes-8]